MRYSVKGLVNEDVREKTAQSLTAEGLNDNYDTVVEERILSICTLLMRTSISIPIGTTSESCQAI